MNLYQFFDLQKIKKKKKKKIFEPYNEGKYELNP